MRDVFARAERVLMWLGGDDGDAATALDLIDKAVNHLEMGTTSLEAPENLKKPSLEQNLSREFPPPEVPSWNAVVELFERPYFERVWILQEVYHAKSSVVLVGAH